MVGRKEICIIAIVSATALFTAGLLASPEPGTEEGGKIGPDVTVYHLPSVSHYGES